MKQRKFGALFGHKSQKDVAVSLVMSVRDTAVELVQRAVKSALIQEIDEGSVEIVIVDDAGIDKRVRNYLKQLRGIKYVRNLRQIGVGRSRERGAHLSRGRFIFFFDSDDEIPPGSIAALLHEADDFDVVDGVVESVNSSGEVGVHRDFPGEPYSRGDHLRDLFQRKRSGMLQGSLYSKRLIGKGCFSVLQANPHDDLVQRAKAIFASTSIKYCDYVTYSYHRRPDSLTGTPSLAGTLGILSSFGQWCQILRESSEVNLLADVRTGFTKSVDPQVLNLMESLNEYEQNLLALQHLKTRRLLEIEA